MHGIFVDDADVLQQKNIHMLSVKRKRIPTDTSAGPSRGTRNAASAREQVFKPPVALVSSGAGKRLAILTKDQDCGFCRVSSHDGGSDWVEAEGGGDRGGLEVKRRISFKTLVTIAIR